MTARSRANSKSRTVRALRAGKRCQWGKFLNGRRTLGSCCCMLRARCAAGMGRENRTERFQAGREPGAAGRHGQAQSAAPAQTRERSWPRLLPVKGAAAAKPAVPAQWTPRGDRAGAGALHGHAQGPRCRRRARGADPGGVGVRHAAPMKLISVGRNPPVALSPPPVVTCDMIAALSRWMARDIQPLARKHLGAPVVRIETMSSYSCRNAYGRKDSRLSEHGRANAVDIGAFVTAPRPGGPGGRRLGSDRAGGGRAGRDRQGADRARPGASFRVEIRQAARSAAGRLRFRTGRPGAGGASAAGHPPAAPRSAFRA